MSYFHYFSFQHCKWGKYDANGENTTHTLTNELFTEFKVFEYVQNDGRGSLDCFTLKNS